MHERTARLAGSLVTVDRELEREFETRLVESSTLAFRVAYGVLRHRQDAEDVAQEAFVKAYRRFGELRDRERFRAWLVRMTWRLAIDRQRNERRRLAREDAAADPDQTAGPKGPALPGGPVPSGGGILRSRRPGPFGPGVIGSRRTGSFGPGVFRNRRPGPFGPGVLEELEARERASRLWTAIDALPDKLRIAIVLANIEEHDIGEVARLLDVPEGTVKSRLFLARQRLKELLQ
jgi:RNA polymerase sigma-70 factor (ECF subfamily)